MPENYSAKLFDHYHHPRNFGIIKKPTHQSEEANPACGDEILVYLQVQDGMIREIKYVARGCALVIAGASVLAERISNCEFRIEDLKKMGKKDMEKLLGAKVGKAREPCIMLGLDTIKKVLKK